MSGRGAPSPHPARSRVVRILAAIVVVLVAVVLSTVVATPRATTSAPKALGPSGQLMPSRAPRGYHAVVAQDFLGTTVPAGWHPYQGQAGSDTAGWWDPSHITVGNGMLTLHAYKDPAHGGPNSPWVEGGIDQWPAGVLVNGEYLVRSRVSSATGVTEVALLWPDDDNWPPEIDFNESNGTNESTATLIWGTGRPAIPHLGRDRHSHDDHLHSRRREVGQDGQPRAGGHAPRPPTAGVGLRQPVRPGMPERSHTDSGQPPGRLGRRVRTRQCDQLLSPLHTTGPTTFRRETPEYGSPFTLTLSASWPHPSRTAASCGPEGGPRAVRG